MDNLTAGNPVAHRVRVYYTGSDIIKEGEPLCYSFKTTRNWWGGSVNDRGELTASDFAVEGTQNASKYMCVESPFYASTTTATSTLASNVLTDNGAEFDNLQVGMAVSIASDNGDVSDGNYVITAVSAANNTITLDMTTAQQAAVTVQTDITVQIDNISSFAGVVAKGGWCGKTGPMVLDIYVPNGAVVPVRNDQNCVLGRTILAINSNEQYLTAPLSSYARPVAIAWETVDTATTTGLVLAKLDPNIFIYQRGDNGALQVDDQDTGAMIVNRINVSFLQASGQCTALWVDAEVGSGGNPDSYDYGLAAYFQSTWRSGSIMGSSAVVGIWLNIDGGAVTVADGGHISALQAGIYQAGDDPWTQDQTTVAAVQLSLNVEDDPGNNCLTYIRMRNDGTHDVDGIFHFNSAADALMTEASISDSTHKLPFIVGTSIYYFMVSSTGS